MKNLIKTLSICLAVMFATICFVGCSPKEPTEPAEPTAVTLDGEITGLLIEGRLQWLATSFVIDQDKIDLATVQSITVEIFDGETANGKAEANIAKWQEDFGTLTGQNCYSCPVGLTDEYWTTVSASLGNADGMKVTVITKVDGKSYKYVASI